MQDGAVLNVREGPEDFFFLERRLLPQYLQGLVGVARKDDVVKVGSVVGRFDPHAVALSMDGQDGGVEMDSIGKRLCQGFDVAA